MSRTMAQLAGDIEIIGFGISEVKALEWLNAANKLAVARARGLKKRLTLDVTDGTGTIELPDTVVEVIRLQVNGRRFDSKPRDDIEDAREGTVTFSPSTRGVYSAEADENGGGTFEVYPTPVAGLAVELLAYVRPDDLALGDLPTVPDEFADGLVAGAAAKGYSYAPEQLGVAADFRSQFDAMCVEYRAWTRRRGRGAGPRQIRVLSPRRGR